MGFCLICKKDLLDLYFMQEVCTSSGMWLKKDGSTLGDSDFPITRVFKQREEVKVWAWSKGGAWDIGWEIGLDQLTLNSPTNLEIM